MYPPFQNQLFYMVFKHACFFVIFPTFNCQFGLGGSASFSTCLFIFLSSISTPFSLIHRRTLALRSLSLYDNIRHNRRQITHTHLYPYPHTNTLRSVPHNIYVYILPLRSYKTVTRLNDTIDWWAPGGTRGRGIQYGVIYPRDLPNKSGE